MFRGKKIITAHGLHFIFVFVLVTIAFSNNKMARYLGIKYADGACVCILDISFDVEDFIPNPLDTLLTIFHAHREYL